MLLCGDSTITHFHGKRYYYFEKLLTLASYRASDLVQYLYR